MNLQNNLIEQLEGALANKDVARRAEVLRGVTDLFVLGSGKFSEDQVELFDGVMSKLLDRIDQTARAQFGNRLAKLPDAPPRTIRVLAFDEAIEVAGPVLQHSEQLDDNALLDNAKSKSQDHLLAISSRKVLVEAVTDVLVERGNQAVILSTARNGGARLSGFGTSALVERARDVDDLALCIWSRSDIPRENLVKLFVDASAALKCQLMEADPRRADSIKTAVAEASDRIQTEARLGSAEFAEARSFVSSLSASGKLDEAQLTSFAKQGSFDKVTVALSLMCNLPIGLVERAFVQSQSEQILVLARAIDLSWVATVTLLLLQAGVNGSSRQQLDQCFASFSQLQVKTAQTALHFYRLREKASRSVT